MQLARRHSPETSIEGLTLDAIIQSSLHVRGGDIAIRPEPTIHGLRAKAISFTELDQRLNRLAGFLATLGGEEEQVALIAAPLGSDVIIAILAALRAGFTPLLAPAHCSAGQLAQLIESHRVSIAIGADRIGDVVPQIALREAASRSFHIRVLAGFGRDTLDGVASLETILADPQAARFQGQPSSGGALFCAPSGDGAAGFAFSETELMASALDVARALAPAPQSRIVTAMSGLDLATLATSLGAALLAGLELAPLGLFGLGKLWASLSDGAPVHLVVPGALEPALTSCGLLRHRALASVIFIHAASVEVPTQPRNLRGPTLIDVARGPADRMSVVRR